MGLKDYKRSKVYIKGWSISSAVDDDGHLVVSISHDDGTDIVDTGEDLALDCTECSSRYTTKGIEKIYTESLQDSLVEMAEELLDIKPQG
jgi:hypothetical protein